VRCVWNRHRLAEPISHHDVRHITAAQGEPHDSDREHEADRQRAAGGYLPVALADHEIGVTLIPFPPSPHIRIRAHIAALHADVSLWSGRAGVVKFVLAEF